MIYSVFKITSIKQLFLFEGEAACRPTSGSLIAELFPPTARGVANGIFNWGIYYGYGLAYILGGPITELDILGYGWRSAYVIR